VLHAIIAPVHTAMAPVRAGLNLLIDPRLPDWT
jgi:hypothetical protein